MSSGYRQIEHTADLALELWAPSEEELLITGATAVVAELTEGATIGAPDARDVELETVDSGDRLVQWLNEAIVLAVTEGFLVAGARITLTDGGLTATVSGEAEAGDRIRQELKAATYHDLRIEQGSDGIWRATVIIDV